MQIEKMIRMGMRCEEACSNPIPIVLPASFAKFIEANWSYKYNTRPTNIRIAGDTQTYIGLFIVYRQEAFGNWKQSGWRQRPLEIGGRDWGLPLRNLHPPKYTAVRSSSANWAFK